MTTGEAWAASDRRPREVTKLPGRGSVLVRSPVPPEVPAARCVDVRPGPCASFDGDRLRLPLVVRADGERRTFDRRELPAVEEAVAASLGEHETEAGGATRAGESEGRAVVRFGDRGACRRLLPAAACLAIERRLAAAASAASAVLVSWTTATPRPVDYRNYDAVLDQPPAGQE